MAKKRTKAERVAAAKAAWDRRRKGLPPLRGLPRKKARSRPDKTHALSTMELGTNVFQLASPGYDMLARELEAAFTQSSAGKGKERHSNGRTFDRQPIMELGRLYGAGFNAGQAAKKTQEALSMLARGKFSKEQAAAEVHGAIVYLASVAALIREG